MTAVCFRAARSRAPNRSEEHTSELSHLGSSYAVFCLKKKNKLLTKKLLDLLTLFLREESYRADPTHTTHRRSPSTLTPLEMKDDVNSLRKTDATFSPSS